MKTFNEEFNEVSVALTIVPPGFPNSVVPLKDFLVFKDSVTYTAEGVKYIIKQTLYGCVVKFKAVDGILTIIFPNKDIAANTDVEIKQDVYVEKSTTASIAELAKLEASRYSGFDLKLGEQLRIKMLQSPFYSVVQEAA